MPRLIQPRSIGRSELMRALLANATIGSAARALGVNPCTVYRTMRDYGLTIPRARSVEGQAGWEALFAQHAGCLRAIARATGLNRTYITRELERYGLRGDYDPWVEGRVA